MKSARAVHAHCLLRQWSPAMTPMLNPIVGASNSPRGDPNGTFKPPKMSPKNALNGGCRSQSDRTQFSGDLAKTPSNLHETLPNSPEFLPTTQRSKDLYSPSSIQVKTRSVLRFLILKPSAFNLYLYSFPTSISTKTRLLLSLKP